jgi:hypothetical protein
MLYLVPLTSYTNSGPVYYSKWTVNCKGRGLGFFSSYCVVVWSSKKLQVSSVKWFTEPFSKLKYWEVYHRIKASFCGWLLHRYRDIWPIYVLKLQWWMCTILRTILTQWDQNFYEVIRIIYQGVLIREMVEVRKL